MCDVFRQVMLLVMRTQLGGLRHLLLRHRQLHKHRLARKQSLQAPNPRVGKRKHWHVRNRKKQITSMRLNWAAEKFQTAPLKNLPQCAKFPLALVLSKTHHTEQFELPTFWQCWLWNYIFFPQYADSAICNITFNA